MSSVKIPSRYNDDASYLSGLRSAGTSRPASGATSHGGRPVSAASAPTPPPINPVLLTSNPASTSQAAYAAAAAGQKVSSLCLPGIMYNSVDISCPSVHSQIDDMYKQLLIYIKGYRRLQIK